MHILFDLDSTLVTIEGIDSLAEMKNLGEHVKKLTNQAMNGEISVEDVFEKRLNLIRPNRKELEAVGELYLQNIVPFASEVISELKRNHKVSIVTGGYETCVMPVALHLGVDQVYSNKIMLNEHDEYTGLDTSVPLWKRTGKAQVLQEIKKKHTEPTLMIGDGVTDLEAGADIFVYFSGVVKRTAVMEKADHVISDLRDLMKLVA